LVIDGHHHRREEGPEIFVEQAALSGVAIGDRHGCPVALDHQAWRRAGVVHRVVPKVRQFVGKTFGAVLIDRRRLLCPS